MKRYFSAFVVGLLLTGCANIGLKSDASIRTRVAATSADYLVVQEGIKGYLLLPPCAGTTLPTCKSPAVVSILQKGNTTASAALDYAETAVTTPGVDPSVVELALGSALEAVKALKATKANLGVK